MLCRALARTLDTTDLVRLAVGGARVCDGCVRVPHPTVVSTVASSNCSRATRSHAALTSIGTFRVRPGFLRLLSHGVEVPGRAANNANDGGNPWHALSIYVVPRSALDRVMERINIAVP